MKFDSKRSTMAVPKLLLPVLLIVWLTTVDNALCSRNAADPQTRQLIADRPKSAPLHPNAWVNRARPAGSAVPPYAVKMEPVVHYSQQDPLYAATPSKSDASAAAKIDFAAGHFADGRVGGASELLQGAASASYGAAAPYPQPDNAYNYNKEPEPIIEIIIKESNESLPAPPAPPPVPVAKPPAKEPVQVFYVKYKKNPNSAYGDKEDIIYEPPVPAITPPSAEVASESETTAFSTESSQAFYNRNNYVTTGPPAPSTTYRTIIKPDSEVYHGTGLKVTFGKTEANWSPSSIDGVQKRDSASEASDAAQSKVKKNADREFKRSFAQPASSQLGDYQRNNNNFENLPNTNPQHQTNGFNLPLQQQQFIKPGQQVQNYFREDNPRPNFHGQIPILNQQLKQNHFEGAGTIEQRPNEFVDHFRNQQQFNRPPNFQPFHNQPNVQQLHPHQQLHNPPNHQQFNSHQNQHQFNNQQPNHQHNILNGQQNNQQFDGQQFNSQQQRQPAEFQFNPSVRNPVHFQDRPVHINGERPFISKPFENHSVHNKPFENRPPQDRPFDHKPFESRPVPDRHFENRPFENRPFENVPVQNRPFENQPVQNKPFENRPIFADRPFDSRPIQNRPVENRPINDRPFDNRQNQGIVNYRPNKPPTPQNIPLNPNPSFTPNDRRPTVPPPQLPSNYNTQPISTKHTVDLAFSPLQQQQQHQQFQQQFGLIENRPPANDNPTLFRQPTIKQQQPTSGVNILPISQYQQQSLRQQQFNSETKPSSAPQVQITPSNGFQLETLEPKQQPAQSGQFIDYYNRHSPTQTEKNSIRPDNIPWQISSQSQSSFKLEPQEYKDHISASTSKNTIDTTSKTIFKTTEKPASFVTLQNKDRSGSTSTVTPVLAATTEVPKNETKKTNLKNIASLPDEVPDELREQLLSSGILSNADIQILDYDKVGDIPIESLPPEALENLYGQGSAPIPSVVLPPSKSNVQMKVVKYDPLTEEGRKIENAYVDQPKAQTLDPVVLNDKGYNRFLPLNINGTHFPIPDSPLLKNKAIGSVVILSPVGYDLSDDQSRLSRNTAVKVKGVHFIVGDIVKNLVKEPNKKNFDIWLEKEKKTPPEEQSVVLLVTKRSGQANDEKEIYMYDVTHNRVNKLSGDLSATFVDVAESNSHSHDLDNLSSEEEVDVVVSGNGANDGYKPDVSGYGEANGFSSGSTAAAAVATANN